MIKVFRRIRQKLITEGRLSKYLIYAIGEIALVMIGILLALQVNNWNESRKDRKDEIGIINRLRDDIIADIEDWNWALRSNDIKKEFLFAILKDELELIPVDEFERYLFTSRFRQLPTPNNSTLDELTSNGKVGLLKNVELKEEILRYYNFIDERSSSMENTFSKWPELISELIPGILHFNARSAREFKLKVEDTQIIKENIMNDIDMLLPAINAELGFCAVQFRSYESIHIRATELLDHLNLEIESRKQY